MLLGLVPTAKFSYGCQNCRVTVSNYQNNSVSWERRGNLISAVNRLKKSRDRNDQVGGPVRSKSFFWLSVFLL